MSLPNFETIINLPRITGGGIFKGNPNPAPESEEDKLRNKETVTAMVRDFINRNPDRKDEILKEWGDVIDL